LKGIWYLPVLPPILLEIVAVTWWPGAGLLQLELVWSGFEVVPWVQHQDNVLVGAVLLLDLVVLLSTTEVDKVNWVDTSETK
jgi:hypothetical protein